MNIINGFLKKLSKGLRAYFFWMDHFTLRGQYHSFSAISAHGTSKGCTVFLICNYCNKRIHRFIKNGKTWEEMNKYYNRGGLQMRV